MGKFFVDLPDFELNGENIEFYILFKYSSHVFNTGISDIITRHNPIWLEINKKKISK